jgi:diguanylate cyclase (GGDEF)-like protein
VVVVLAAVMVAEVVGGVQAAADPPDRVAFCVTMAAMLIGTAVVVRLLQRRIVQLVTILADVARTDALTNCGNRRAFHERLAEVHARGRRGGPTPIVILVDLDDLKAINDRGGHPAGDAVLTAAGAALAGEVRAGEAAFRIGGDEFAVIATSDDPAAIDALSDRFARALAGVDVAAALGASSSESRIEHPDDLVARADRALYAAKARRPRPPTPA